MNLINANLNVTRMLAWAEALRSGLFKQGFSMMREGDCFCALGVACEVSGLGRWEDVEVGREVPWKAYVIGDGLRGNTAEACLPDAVRRWLGVDSEFVMLGANDAMYLNDVARLSFSEIADEIVKEVDKHRTRATA